MRFAIAAALALTAGPLAASEGAPLATDLSYVTPIVGDWSYSATSDGSETAFSNASGEAQVTIRCTRSTRRVAILKAATGASPTLWVWTSSRTQSLPATYDSATAQVSADLAAFDPLLDAMALSRGRIGFSTSGVAALVVPPWTDVARVIEDCRV